MSEGIPRKPLILRNRLSASIKPVAHQRRFIEPSLHRLTRPVSLAVAEKADSMGLVVCRWMAKSGSIPRRVMVMVSSSPSRRLRAASGAIRSSQAASVLRRFDLGPELGGHVSFDVSLLVSPATLHDATRAPQRRDRLAQSLRPIDHEQRGHAGRKAAVDQVA